METKKELKKEQRRCGNCANVHKGEKFWSCEEFGFWLVGCAPVDCTPPNDKACRFWTDDPKKANSWMRYV